MISLRLALLGIAAMQGFDLAVAFLPSPRKEAAQIGEVALAGAEGDVVAVEELGNLRMPTSQFT